MAAIALYLPIDWDGIYSATKSTKKTVAISDLFASQNYFDIERVNEITDDQPTSLIWVYARPDNKFTIRDGHHRVIAALRNNQSHIRAVVFHS